MFLDNFPDVAAKYQSRDKELSERENIALCPVNTSQQNEELKRNVTAQHQLSSDPLEVCSDNDVACYQAIRSSELLWNASDLVFGSFHQNDGRFSEHSRGYQCTCIALCMLSYAHCCDVDNSRDVKSCQIRHPEVRIRYPDTSEGSHRIASYV